MLYTELVDIINQTIQSDDEQEFEDNIENFVRMAEDQILKHVQLPLMTKTATTTCNVGSQYITLPDDYIAPLYIAIVDGNNHSLLIQKDSSWLIAAYPATAPGDQAIPRYYSVDDENSVRFRPVPDQAYTVEFEYSHKPDSLVDAIDGNGDPTTTWISLRMRPALVNGALMHAAIFIGDDARAAQFKEQFLNELGITKLEQQDKARTDRRREDYRRNKP